MSPTPFCEPLEERCCFATTQTALDASYHLAADAVRKVAGANVEVYDATPGPDGRTYLLAQYFDDSTEDRTQTQHPGAIETPGHVAVAAVRSDGTLDPSFGTHGVALTGLVPRPLVYGEPPGMLKVDPGGRVYFADNARILRLHADGTTDSSFGTAGAYTYASDRKPTSLTDLAAIDGGVYVSVTATDRGRQRVTVFKIVRGHEYRETYRSEHDSGATNTTFRGDTLADSSGNTVTGQTLSPGVARFAVSRGGLVLTRIDQDVTRTTVHGHTRVRVANNIMFVRFEQENGLRFGIDIGGVPIDNGPNGGGSAASLDGVALSASGKVLTASAGSELLRLAVRAHKVTPYDKPTDAGGQPLDVYVAPNSDVYTLGPATTDADGTVRQVRKFAFDATPDTTFADDGVATFHGRQFGDADDVVEQIFLDTAGRLNLLAQAPGYPTSVTLARL